MSASMRREVAKAKKVLHPNSRKTTAIIKKVKIASNKQNAKLASMIKKNLIGEKMLWMQQHMDPNVCPYTPELTAYLLLNYIQRNDEELEQIAIKHSVGGKRGRQHASREDIIRMTKEREQEEFNTCGIEIPNILIPTQCEMLRKWNGELRFLPKFKFRRFGKSHLRDELQRIEKQSKTAMNKSTNCIQLEGSSASSVISNAKDRTEKDIESNAENRRSNTILVEKTTLNECPMDTK